MENRTKIRELLGDALALLNEKEDPIVAKKEPVINNGNNEIYKATLVDDSIDIERKSIEIDIEYESNNNMLVVAVQENGGDWTHFYRYTSDVHSTGLIKRRVVLEKLADVDVDKLMIMAFLTQKGWNERTAILSKVDVKTKARPVGVPGVIREGTTFLKGPNIAGGAFGHSAPDTSRNFTYNRPGGYGIQSFELKYWITQKKASVIRIPVGWERIQDKLYGELNQVTVNELKRNVDEILALGGNAVIDLHNYLRYTTSDKEIMSMNGDLNPNHLYDVWKKIATIWKDDKYKNRVILNLMNEPHDIGQDVVKMSMIQAVKGVRDAGNKTLVLISGNLYATFAHFTSSVKNGHGWTGLQESSADIFEGFEKHDSADNWGLDLHHYIDSDGAGKGKPLRDNDVHIAEKQGVKTLQWARYNPDGTKRVKPYRIFIGEFGMPLLQGGALELFVQATKNQIKYIEENDDVFIGYALWSAGISWGRSYNIGLDPEWQGDIENVQQAHGVVVKVNSQNVTAKADGVTMSKVFPNGTF